MATIAHQERREHLDRLEVLRRHTFGLDHLFMSLFSTLGWVLRLGIVVTLLATRVHPVLALLLVFALPTVLTATWRPGVERAVQDRTAPDARLARHLFVLGTTAAPGKEVRVTGNGDDLANKDIPRVMHAKEYPRHPNAYGQCHERQRQRGESTRVNEGYGHRRGSVPRGERESIRLGDQRSR